VVVTQRDSAAMMKMWGDFAKTGNPTPVDGKWRPWDSIGQAKMNINQVPLCGEE
jgi:hypothetical protein